jgi:hypothetical protein
MNRYVFSYIGQELRPTIAEFFGRVATLVETLAERGVDIQLGQLAVEKGGHALVVLAEILGPPDWIKRAEPMLADERIRCVPCA